MIAGPNVATEMQGFVHWQATSGEGAGEMTGRISERESLTVGRIVRKDVSELCRINDDQATYLLRKMCRENKLELVGRGRGAYYRKP